METLDIKAKKGPQVEGAERRLAVPNATKPIGTMRSAHPGEDQEENLACLENYNVPMKGERKAFLGSNQHHLQAELELPNESMTAQMMSNKNYSEG